MAELNSIESLLAARDILKSSLEKSREIAFAIDKTGQRLEEISRGIPSLEASIKTIASKCALFPIRVHVDRAVGPAVAVVKIFDVVRELENSISAKSCSDLFDYLYNLKRLEEALRFLTDNCKLVILWLEDVAQFLEDNKVANDHWYILNVNKCMRVFMELQAIEERSLLKGGSLNTSFEKLEKEFRQLLGEISFPPVEDSSLSSLGDQTCIANPFSLPLLVIPKLHAIIERLSAHNRLDRCISIYVDVRSSTARTTLQTLDLDYLEISLSEFDSVQSIEANNIDQWGRHLEFAVKHLLELEYRLCSDVFEKVGSDVSTDSFAKIAVQCGMHNFIKFGNIITQGKKEAIKLFKLLDIFAALNRLRSDFNQLFGGKACVEIQTQTRDLIKKVVNGACEIFWELSLQVELQRQSIPPSDGSTPRLVSFVTDYSNQLLNDNYKLIMAQVMEIHWSWNHGTKFKKEIVLTEVRNIVNSLELNLETWAKTYEDTALSYLFKMNNHWCLYKNLKGTKLGDLMGEAWLMGHEENVEYYGAAYLRESWGNLPGVLSEEGLILFEGGRAVDRDLVRKRINAFSEAFDETYRKQLGWVVSDKGLRWKMCEVVAEAIVPVYKRYMQKYIMPWSVEQESGPGKYVKYSVERLESMVRSLFQPKIGKYGSAKCTQLMGDLKNAVRNHFSSTPAAA